MSQFIRLGSCWCLVAIARESPIRVVVDFVLREESLEQGESASLACET